MGKEKDFNDSIIKPLSLKHSESFMGVDYSPDELAEMEKMSQALRNAKKRFEAILLNVGREGTEHLLLELRRNSFFHAPASTRFHDNVPNGLLYHSLNVYDCAMRIRSEMLKDHPELDSELNENSVAVAALLHDVCKADEYIIDWEAEAKPVKVQPKFPLGGHGDKSVIKILMWGYQLLPEEILAIKWHMGEKHLTHKEDIENCKRAKENALCRVIIKADYEASHAGQ